MFFGYFTLAVAFFLSVVAAYYSVLGLVAIFSAAAIPVIIMGGALETGKVVAAMWLHRNWHRAPWTYKAYLLPSLLALMLLTSMGTFGYLSKAHSDQSLVSGDVTSKIALYDEKIKIARENIDANRRALKQLDEAVDQVMGRSTSESGAERSVQIRRQQGPERQRLIREIEAEQKKISSLNEERAPIAAEVRKVEAEVGPIKYIAALLYGDDPEANLLESAVRWVIILIVIVFDPLAIVLILAGTRHLEWEREAKKVNKDQQPSVEPQPEPIVQQSEPIIEQPSHEPDIVPETKPKLSEFYLKPGTWFKWRPFETASTSQEPNVKPKAQGFIPESIQSEQLPDPVEPTEPQVVIPENQPKTKIIAAEEPVKLRGRQYIMVEDKPVHIDAARDLYPEVYQKAIKKIAELDQQDQEKNASFGSKFPINPTKGHMHVHTGTLPSKLYKFNGIKWIEVDKQTSSSYTHNESYVQYLVQSLDSGLMELEDLTSYEQELVTDYKKSNVK